MIEINDISYSYYKDAVLEHFSLNIKEGESIADHCWGVVLLTHILSSELDIKLDRNKAVSMAIAHELGETRIGDIPYTTLKYFPNKREMENAAINDILSPLSERTFSLSST